MSYTVRHPLCLDGKLETTGGTLTTIAITASVASPTVCTAGAAHGLVSGDRVRIASSTTTPSIDGDYTATVTGATTFTIPVNVTSGGTATGTITKWATGLRPYDTMVNRSTGEYLTLYTANSTTFSAPGSHTGNVTLGITYTMEVILSTPYIRDDRGLADIMRELLIERVIVGHKDSIDYTIQIELSGGRSLLNRYNDETKIGSFGLNSFGVHQTWVMGNAEEAEVTILNATPRPSTITSVQYECWASERPR